MKIEPKPSVELDFDDEHAQEMRERVPPAGPAPLDELLDVYNAIDNPAVQTKVFDVQGSKVAVRYRRLSYDESDAALNGPGSLWERNAQFLIDACEEILYRNPAKDPGPDGDGNLEPIRAGQTVTFDLRPGESIPLHQALGVDEPDIRRSVLRLFQGADRVLLLHAQRVDAWMDTLRRDAKQAFAGG